jgi:DNA-binding MarR family transcriptional regulator
MERSHPGDSREDIAEALEQASILTTRHISDQAALSLTAARALGRLNEEGPIRLTTLAAAEGISQPSMTQLIQRLERQGLARPGPEAWCKSWLDRVILRVAV